MTHFFTSTLELHTITRFHNPARAAPAEALNQLADAPGFYRAPARRQQQNGQFFATFSHQHRLNPANNSVANSSSANSSTISIWLYAILTIAKQGLLVMPIQNVL